jgi:hypothetical protein
MKNWERKLFIITLVITFSLIPLHFLGEYASKKWDIQAHGNLFNLDEESSIGTWYSSILLFSCAISLFALYAKKRKKAWLGLSALFLYLSTDEFAGFHNIIGGLLNNIFIKPVFSIDMSGYAWVILGLPAVIIIFYLMKKELQDSMPKKAKYLAATAFAFIIIAIISETTTLIQFLKGLNTSNNIEIIIEETSELISINLFLYSFLLTLKRNRFKNTLLRK